MVQEHMMILSLGGSLIFPKEIDVAYLKQFRQLILHAVTKGKRFGIVCGGGFLAREYMKRGNEIVPLQPLQNDWLGIAATHANAQFVREIFGESAYEDIISDYSKTVRSDKAILIGAGWKPGCSTDYDAVLFAQITGAKIVVNLTNVDYVYDKDPQKYSHAKPIKKTTWQQFKAIVGGEWKAGMNLPFDPVAAALAEKEKMQVIILNGRNMENFEHFLSEKEFIGTIIG